MSKKCEKISIHITAKITGNNLYTNMKAITAS